MELDAHLNFKAFNVLIVPFVPMQTDPVAAPGTRTPSPVSAVTTAVKLSAAGLVAAFFT